MLTWLVDNRVRESWARYSVAVYLGLLLAGTLSAQPPAPPGPPEPGLDALASDEPPAWLVPVSELRDVPIEADPLAGVQER